MALHSVPELVRVQGMPRNGKEKAAADPRQPVVGRWLGVPTDFFNVATDGRRYLARISMVHATKTEMVRMRFAQAYQFKG